MSVTEIDSSPNRAKLAGTESGRGVSSIDVAIVIVTYKSAQMTIEALRSLLTARATPEIRIRAVIVDNASGDLPQIAQAVEQSGWSSWVTLVTSSINGGFAYGNNLGIEHAYSSGTPSYVYLLNPDTQVRPGAIASLVRFMQAHPQVGIVGSGFEKPDGSDWPIAFRFPSLISELIQGLELRLATRLLEQWNTVRHMAKCSAPVDWISGASVMIRPLVLEAIGGLDENYFLCFEETDFCRRARSAGFPTWYVPESRVMHIGGESTNPSHRRRPAYWFESRRRYFAVTFGIPCSIAIDFVAVTAHVLGSLKRIIQRRQHTAVPFYIRDLIRYSVLWARNRDIPPFRSRLTDPEN
jgi:N-acetylglucosaminyl-diphospho-decaprenol L-rhamnosyltransferase